MKFDPCHYVIKRNNIWRCLHSIYISVQNGQNCEGYKEESVVTYVVLLFQINPYPTAFPYGNGMVLHFYQQQESSTTKTVHNVINKRLKTYV